MPHILEILKALNASSLEVLNLVLEFCRHKNLQSRYKVLETFRPLKASSGAEMEYCASPASMSMLAEEIWEIAEGFVEVPVNLLVQLKKCGKNIPND